MACKRPSRQRGAAFLLLMFLIALAGILLAVTGQVTATAARREREKQLLFAGEAYRRAIARYHDAPSALGHEYPQKIEQLLLDKRQPTTERYLRRLYRDPMTDSLDWGLVKEGERIVGVYSRGAGVPIKQGGFPREEGGFAGARNYAGWKFVATAGEGSGPAAAAPAASGSATADPAAPIAASPMAGGEAGPTPAPQPPVASPCAAGFAAQYEQCPPDPIAGAACRRAALWGLQKCARG